MIAWLAALAVSLGFVAALIARAKGRSFVLWLAYGALLGVIAVPHALLLRDRHDEQGWQFSRFGFPGRDRACPHCGATVYAEAVVCRRCRQPLYDDAANVNGTPRDATRHASAVAASATSTVGGSTNSAGFAWLDDAFARMATDNGSPIAEQRRDSRAAREDDLSAPDPALGRGRGESAFTTASAGADKRAGGDAWVPVDFSPATHGDVRFDRRESAGLRHASRVVAAALIAAVVIFVAWRAAPLLPELLTWAALDRRFESVGGDVPAIVAAPDTPQPSRGPEAPPLRPAVPDGDVSVSAPPMDDVASTKKAEPEPKIDEPMPPMADAPPVQEATRPAPDPELPTPRGDETEAPQPETDVTTSSTFIAAVEKALRESGGGTRSSRPASPASGGVTASGEIVAMVQQRLRQRGYNPGTADGRAGPQTQMAIRAFQRDVGMKPDGEIDIVLLQRLGIVGEQIFVFGR